MENTLGERRQEACRRKRVVGRGRNERRGGVWLACRKWRQVAFNFQLQESHAWGWMDDASPHLASHLPCSSTFPPHNASARYQATGSWALRYQPESYRYLAGVALSSYRYLPGIALDAH